MEKAEKAEKTGKENLALNVSGHLVGDHYIMPDAPPFGEKDEKQYIAQMKLVRNKLEKIVWGECPNCKAKAMDSLFAFASKRQCGKCGELVEFAFANKYNKDVNDYRNERHKFVLRYAFVAQKIASMHCKQCQHGMGYDDLCQAGFAAILNAVDKWPPFLGKPDKGARILTSIQVAVHNAVCRFLDDHNRRIKVPSYKIEQIAVRLKADAILYGKLQKTTKDGCQEKKCCKCQNMYAKGCRRKKPGQFELGVQDFIAKVFDIKNDEEHRSELIEAILSVDGKSLRDIALETGRYRDLAEAVNLDVSSIISIIEPVGSIDVPLNDDNEGTVGDMIQSREYDSNHQVFLRESIEEALDQIVPRNASILRDHFFGDMSIREIAEKYGFSAMRASDLINKSINQIQRNEAAMNILLHKIVGR